MDTNKLFTLGVNLMKAQASDFNENDIYKENLSVNKSFSAIMPIDPNWTPVIARKQAHPECNQCQSDDSMTPNHDGSRFCESGSIAAKGTKSHCTCDFCYY